MHMIKTLIKAQFVAEDKTRFSCTVSLNNKMTKCYVPSTCKLRNLLDLECSDALLTNNTYQKNVSPYSLFALKIKGEYVIINSGFANRVVKHILMSKHQEIFAEKVVKNYKCDFYLKQKNKIIEVKSIISDKAAILLPNIKSQRAIMQLRQIKSLLTEGYNVEYYFVLFAPFLKKCVVDSRSEYGELLKDCIENGMKIKIYRSVLDDNLDLVTNICRKSFLSFTKD